MSGSEAARTAERVARDSYGRLVAFLAARTHDVAGAEDALSEAFSSALRTWPETGIPDNPDAWLFTVARRRQTDVLRRRRTHSAGEAHLQLLANEISDETEGSAGVSDIPDRRLALMFACAHPDIERGMRAPLILQTILGLTAIDIAAAFLIPPSTMGQRLVRAKARIKEAGIPFAVPEREDLAERLGAVLDAVYAAYTKGWTDAGDAAPELAEEAIWLGRLLVSLLPDEPEGKGMLALMLYAEARRAARRDANGAYVPLDRQDTALWDYDMLGLAERLLREASAGGPTGRYQLEAAIQSAHAVRRMTGADTWPAILALYGHLEALTGSPVVTLNRAVALAETEGAEAGLALLEAIAPDRRLADYQPLWAARGHLLARLGRRGEAREALTVAMGLATDNAVRHYLQWQIAGLADG